MLFVQRGISAHDLDDRKISSPRPMGETLFPILLASMQRIKFPLSL
jgi:hypothetical protein